MENLSLYEINSQLAKLLALPDGNAVDTETGEIFTQEAWEELNLAQEVKLEQTLLWCKGQAALVKAIKEEAKALTERAKAIENAIERAENRVTYTLMNDDKYSGKLETSRLKASTKTTYSTPKEIDIEMLSAEYVKEIPASKDVDRKKLLADLQALRKQNEKEGKEDIGSICGISLVPKTTVSYK